MADANKKIKDDGFSLFGIFFMMMLFKGVFASFAGPGCTSGQEGISSRQKEKKG
jgi:SSS family solute:Na+ symporter